MPVSVPTRARPVEESQSLAEKRAAQIKWMQEKGITGPRGTPRVHPRPADVVRLAVLRTKNSG